MAEQDVLDKIDDCMDKIDGLEAKVSADSILKCVCGNCGDGLVGGEGCSHCGGTGIRQRGTISKVEA